MKDLKMMINETGCPICCITFNQRPHPSPSPRGEGICTPIVGRDLLAKKAKRILYEKTDYK